MHKQSGLALIEILIAAILMAFIMLAVQNAVDEGFRTKNMTVQDNENNLTLSAFYQRFSWDFGHIYSPRYFSNPFQAQDPDNPEKTVTGSEQFLSKYQGNRNFSGPNDGGLPIPIYQSNQKNEFIFLSTGYRRKLNEEKNSQFAWIQYTLKKFEPDPEDNDSIEDEDNAQNSEGETLIRRIYTQNPWTRDEIDFENVKSQRILNGVTSLVFRFWDEERRKFVENIGEVKDARSLLRAVQIEITYIDREGVEMVSKRIFTPLSPRFIPETEQELSRLRQEFKDDNEDKDDEDEDDEE